MRDLVEFPPEFCDQVDTAWVCLGGQLRVGLEGRSDLPRVCLWAGLREDAIIG